MEYRFLITLFNWFLLKSEFNLTSLKIITVSLETLLFPLTLISLIISEKEGIEMNKSMIID